MEIEYTKSFLKDLKNFKKDPIILHIIEKKIEEFRTLSVSELKSRSKLLTGSTKHYRYRIGKYRIIYTITENNKIIIILIAVGKRDKIYNDYK